MKYFRFKGILLDDGWITPGIAGIDDQGQLSFLGKNLPDEDGELEEVNGYALPGFQNAHSHAFQYAMAGIAEKFNYGSSDDFWSWRETMYKIALTIGPDEMESIASMLYAEMVRHGYTHVAEFHYIHHDQSGAWYSNPAELGERLIAAAESAGIKITLVPIFYQKGGFGQEPNDRQKRFICKDADDYRKLWDASKTAVDRSPNASLGYGIHSLRAIDKKLVRGFYESFPGDLPFHMHISEQIKEVEDAIPYLGERPAAWLLKNLDVNGRCHLVHATHLSNTEVKELAQSGAHVVLCPSTEGNLGDGIFRYHDYKRYGGKWSIGTDSHVGLNPLEELRILDYGQRLTTHQRSTFISSNSSNNSISGYDQALTGGRKSMGNNQESYFETGASFDAVVYGGNLPLITTSGTENLMSSIIYTGDAASTLGTIINGEWVVKENIHRKNDEIQSRFKETMLKLKIR